MALTFESLIDRKRKKVGVNESSEDTGEQPILHAAASRWSTWV